MSTATGSLGHTSGSTRESARAGQPGRKPSMTRKNALMDAAFRNLTRFFAFLVFSLLAAILGIIRVARLEAALVFRA